MEMTISDDAFARMVSEDIKNKLSSSEKKILLQQENWPRWKEALLLLIDNLDTQIQSIIEDADADSNRYSSMGRSGERLAAEAAREYQYRIKKIDRFKFYVNKKLDEVVSMIESGNPIEPDGWTRASFLENAIYKHRSMLREYELEDTAVDRALWAALEGKWEFDSISEENL